MALREMDGSGRLREVPSLPYLDDFERTWFAISSADRAAIEAEINGRLDHLVTSPDPNWGSITNTSIEGGKLNPVTGIRGDWRDTVFDAIFAVCNLNENLAGMFYGNVWKKVIIDRDDHWIGIRADPTFQNRGVTLQGKTYFIDTERR
ncbi:MAG: hypothetical protein ABIR70_04880 [Bryobacteraceae bacterium]